MGSFPEWRHVAVRQDGGVTELRLHSDDGPLRWNARIHRELAQLAGIPRRTKE